MSFKRPYLYYQPEDLTWLTRKDMRATWVEQAERAADELRGILVHIDCGTKHGKWLGYDQFREEWKYADRNQVLDLIHVVTLAWYKGIQRTGDSKLTKQAERFYRLTAAREIYTMMGLYLPAHPANFVPSDHV